LEAGIVGSRLKRTAILPLQASKPALSGALTATTFSLQLQAPQARENSLQAANPPLKMLATAAQIQPVERDTSRTEQEKPRQTPSLYTGNNAPSPS
jgi:hypothetical protein